MRAAGSIAAHSINLKCNHTTHATIGLTLPPTVAHFTFYQLVKELSRLDTRSETLSTAHRAPPCHRGALFALLKLRHRTGLALSYTRSTLERRAFSCWWSWSGSNRRPSACKADALPAELQPPLRSQHTNRSLWWVWLGSNQRPPPYQDGALTS
jgi:hypothetical protein